jgi:hypothetical protein
MYLHLSGTDLLARMTEAIRYTDAKIGAALFAEGGVINPALKYPGLRI